MCRSTSSATPGARGPTRSDRATRRASLRCARLARARGAALPQRPRRRGRDPPQRPLRSAPAAEAEQRLGDVAHLDLLRALGDPVAAVVAVDVLERLSAGGAHAPVGLGRPGGPPADEPGWPGGCQREGGAWPGPPPPPRPPPPRPP